jgi:hypothetical protein
MLFGRFESFVYNAPRLPPSVLLQHANIRHHHSPVGCLAHVVDGEQADLHGGEGFHLDARRAGGFHGCSTNNARQAICTGATSFERDSNARESQRMAERNQVAVFLRSLNACDACYAQAIAFSGISRFNQNTRCGSHRDASADSAA